VKATLRVYATGLWTGFFPIAPGTAGSVLALALYCWIPSLPLRAESFGLATLAFLVPLVLVGVYASRRGEREFGEDGGPIVVDEVLGQWLAVCGLDPTPFVVIGGFLLFRLFDIFKPPPAGRSQRWGGGWGVMADDIIAGIYAAIVLRVAMSLPPFAGL
jgi:phosphatidylglycerophosphatase A